MLVSHGLDVLTFRAYSEVASRYGLKEPSGVVGSGSGFIIDKDKERMLVFDCNAKVRELPFSTIDSWERHGNVIKLNTLEEYSPVVTVGKLSDADAEQWHQRLVIVLGRV